MRRHFDDRSPWIYAPEQANITFAAQDPARNWGVLFASPVFTQNQLAPDGASLAYSVQDADNVNFCGAFTQTPTMQVAPQDVVQVQAFIKDLAGTSFAVLRVQGGGLLGDLAITANAGSFAGGNQTNCLVISGSVNPVGNGWFLAQFNLLCGVAINAPLLTSFFPAAGSVYPTYSAPALGNWGLWGMNIRRIVRN